MTFDQRVHRYRRGVAYKTREFYAARVGPRLSTHRRGAVAMFHVGRSGSTVLADLLGRHPMMFWDGEIYRKHLQRQGLTFETVDATTTRLQPPDLSELVAQSGPLHYGCEVKFFHFERFEQSLDEVIAQLVENDFDSVVILRRNNTLAKVVSSLRASQSGTYNSDDRRPMSHTELPPLRLAHNVEIDATSMTLLRHLDGYERHFAALDRRLDGAPFDVLRLTYEDDIRSDPTIAYRKVISHLGLPAVPVKPRIRKLATGRQGYYDLANDHEVRSWLAGTAHEWMVDDLGA